ncbi:MAG: TrmH family RNA methyltransferase [Propionibacteriaceae bacterium]
MADLITSTSNPTIKRARALMDRKHRRLEGCFLVEGGQPVWRAVELGWHIDTLIVAPALVHRPEVHEMVQRLRDQGVRVVDVAPNVYNVITEREHPGGLAAIVRMRSPHLSDITVADDTVVVALEQVGNPGNLGTIIRTADAAGAAAVILLGDVTDPYAPIAVKASMGSLFSVPVIHTSREDFQHWAHESGVTTVATSGTAADDHWSAHYHRPLALLFGNEGTGLSAEALDFADTTVRIPMTGSAESLNLAAAAAILLYEVARPRP